MKKTILSLAVMFTFAVAANNVATALNLSTINIELEDKEKKNKKKCDKKCDKACCSKDKKAEGTTEANADAPKKCSGAEGKAKCCSKDKATE